jgi:hypothetical protein
MELRRIIAALAVSVPLSLFATLAGSQTINFGAKAAETFAWKQHRQAPYACVSYRVLP